MNKQEIDEEMKRVEKINQKYEKQRQKKISRLLFRLYVKKIFRRE